MADYRGGFNSNDGNQSSIGAVAGFRGNFYRGRGSYVQKESDVTGHSGSNRGGYAQHDNNSVGGEGIRYGRGSCFSRGENQSGGYRGNFFRGRGSDSYSRGGSDNYGLSNVGGPSDNYSRGAYRGSGESQTYPILENCRRQGIRGSFNRGGGVQVDDGEQSGGYQGGRRVYDLRQQGLFRDIQDFIENRDATAASVTSACQPTAEEKDRFEEWSSSITKPLPFKKTFLVTEDTPKEPVIQQIVQKKMDELSVENTGVVRAQDKPTKIDGSETISLAEKSVSHDKSDSESVAEQPPIPNNVPTGIEKEKDREYKQPVMDADVKTLAEVVTVLQPDSVNPCQTSVPIKVDPDLSNNKLKESVSLRKCQLETPSVSMHTFAKDDLKKLAEVSGMFKDAFSKLAEVSGMFKDAFSKLHELMTQMLRDTS